MADVLLRKGDIELDRRDLDGAHIRFDDIPPRNILVAESGQTYILNEAVGLIQRGEFSVHPVSIEITGRRIIRESNYGEPSIRVRVIFQVEGYVSGRTALGLLIFGKNKGRLEGMQYYYNLDYKVRPRIEDVEEFGE